MRQVTRKGLITVAAATGVLAISGGYAQADSGAAGSASNSPGVLSGNSVQLPVHVPVNVCGNSVNVVGVLNPAVGNNCANTSDDGGSGSGSNKPSGGGSSAHGHSSDSPGVGSGNDVQLPIDVPVNVCGNSVTLVGLGNATAGDDCVNDSGEAPPPGGEHPPTKPEQPPGGPEQPGQPGEPEQPGKPGTPGEKPSDDRAVPPGSPEQGSPEQPGSPNEPGAQTVAQPKGSETLAQTGSDLPMGVVLPVGAGMLLAGTVLYRRSRSAA
ncbi:chaplin family protein [Streptomyces sp. NPDC059900]|uniref:chaplin n=1 Tax=Streptomyces sp. NPDC059900 TaxID=3155816 RepID=UPI00341E4909